MTVTVVVGNPKPRSRTWAAAHRVARELTGAEPDTAIDLADFGPALLDWSDPGVAEAVADLAAAELLVVASPTFKGTYTGLLKLFLDRVGGGALVGVTAVPVMLGAHWRHGLAPEAFLKPVLAELGAACPTGALYLLDSAWDAPDALDHWLPAARRQLATTRGEPV